MDNTNIKEAVREKYGEAALRMNTGGSACCGATAASNCGPDPITSNLYDASQSGEIPAEALLASLGCGNPTALAKLAPGEVVLDLGSGGGIDVLLSAKRVGPTGKAYGLDMTDEMLALANENKTKSGITNVEFLKGEIESIPLPDNSVDVVISNCVINLSADKGKVLREAFRVLKPGVVDSPFRMWLPAEKSCLRFARVFCYGWDVSQGRWMKVSIATNSPQLDLKRWMSSQLAFIALQTRANFLPARDWMSKHLRRRSTANS